MGFFMDGLGGQDPLLSMMLGGDVSSLLSPLSGLEAAASGPLQALASAFGGAGSSAEAGSTVGNTASTAEAGSLQPRFLTALLGSAPGGSASPLAGLFAGSGAASPLAGLGLGLLSGSRLPASAAAPAQRTSAILTQLQEALTNVDNQIVQSRARVGGLLAGGCSRAGRAEGRRGRVAAGHERPRSFG